MLKEFAKKYYFEQGYNCAEAILRAANDAYNLGITTEDMKLISGFGGGMCCGKTCGAICGAIAVISRCTVNDRAHTTENFSNQIREFVKRCEEVLGGELCDDLVKKYKQEDIRCLLTVEKTAAVLEDYMQNLFPTMPY